MTVVSLMLRFYGRVYKEVLKDPDEALDSMLSFGKKVGIDTSFAAKFRDSIIGEKSEDFGIIECRKYRQKLIEYAASFCQAEGKKQIVLRITEKLDRPRLIDLLMSDVDVTYCPLGQKACMELANILGPGEDVFLEKAREAEAIYSSGEGKRSFWGRIKDRFMRRVAFQPLKYFGIIDKATRSWPLRHGKEGFWFQSIGAYIGREDDEILLLLRLRSKLVVRRRFVRFLYPAVFNYLLYFPFGAPSREFLRKVCHTIQDSCFRTP